MKNSSNRLLGYLGATVAATSLACATPQTSTRPHEGHTPTRTPEVKQPQNSSTIRSRDLLTDQMAAQYAGGAIDIITDKGGCQGFLTYEPPTNKYNIRTAHHCIDGANNINIEFKKRANFDRKRNSTRKFRVRTTKSQWTCNNGVQGRHYDPVCTVDLKDDFIPALKNTGFTITPSIYRSDITIPQGAAIVVPNERTGTWTVYQAGQSDNYNLVAYSVGETAVSYGLGGLCQGNSGSPALLANVSCNYQYCSLDLIKDRGYPVSVGHLSAGDKIDNTIATWKLQDGRECSVRALFTR